jgi:hypothetical protein
MPIALHASETDWSIVLALALRLYRQARTPARDPRVAGGAG